MNYSKGRLRITGKYRLIGFVIPDEFAESEFAKNKGKKIRYCTNILYVVFLDEDYVCYKVEKKNT